MKLLRNLALVFFTLCLLVLALTYWEVEQQTDLGLTTIYATEHNMSNIPIVGQFHSWLSERKLYSLKECPYLEFAPTSPLMFVVSGLYRERNSVEKSQKLFRHFQSIGCNINRPNKSQEGIAGLRPLHMVMLSRDLNLVNFLIEHGADKNLKISSPHSLAGYTTLDWLAKICQKRKENCKELERVLR